MRPESPIWRPYTQHALAGAPEFVSKAKGAYLYARGGRKIFDAVSSWWVTLHGHAEPRIAEAVAAQARKLDHVIFAGFSHEPAEALARGLVRAAPKGLTRVFFSDDGSTAVEVAVKMAVGYWANKGRARKRLAALEHGYHGDTLGAMSVSARSVFTALYDPLLFPVDRIPFPFKGREGRTLESLRRLLNKSGKDIAAFIAEPLVLGAGGMLMYPAAVLREMRDICRSRDVLFIADEVLTGFGRTGALFACEQAGISPDIMCLSKGLTGGFMALGATLASEEVFRAFYCKDRAKTFFHGHSYTANPIACAAAAASLRIFGTDPVFKRIRAISEVHESRLKRLAGRPKVARAEHAGTIAAVELDGGDSGYLSRLGPRLSRFYLSRGVLLRPLGGVVYLIPPYCSARADLVKAYDAIEESLDFV